MKVTQSVTYLLSVVRIALFTCAISAVAAEQPNPRGNEDRQTPQVDVMPRVEDYTHMWWAEGFPSHTPSGAVDALHSDRPLCDVAGHRNTAHRASWACACGPELHRLCPCGQPSLAESAGGRPGTDHHGQRSHLPLHGGRQVDELYRSAFDRIGTFSATGGCDGSGVHGGGREPAECRGEVRDGGLAGSPGLDPRGAARFAAHSRGRGLLRACRRRLRPGWHEPPRDPAQPGTGPGAIHARILGLCSHGLRRHQNAPFRGWCARTTTRRPKGITGSCCWAACRRRG